VVFNHNGEIVEPPPEGAAAKWSAHEAKSVITSRSPEGRTRVWFGSYHGGAAWLAITDGTRRGYRFGVFADGESPAHLLSGSISGRGAAPAVNAAPQPRKYNGRLHVTFVTRSGGAVGGSLAKWMMEPAPWAHPRQSIDEATRRSEGTSADPGGTSKRVYFGLFTGLDNTGAMHVRTKAWVVLARHVRLVAYGPTKNRTPQFGYGVTAFSDDLTQPWVTGQLSSAGQPPLAY
jgi:hypothetical protein